MHTYQFWGPAPAGHQQHRLSFDLVGWGSRRLFWQREAWSLKNGLGKPGGLALLLDKRGKKIKEQLKRQWKGANNNQLWKSMMSNYSKLSNSWIYLWSIKATCLSELQSKYLTWTQQDWEHACYMASEQRYLLHQHISRTLMQKMLYAPALQTWMISKPMFSPSRSQSVQITRAWHCWTSRSRVLWDEKTTQSKTWDIPDHLLCHLISEWLTDWTWHATCIHRDRLLQ